MKTRPIIVRRTGPDEYELVDGFNRMPIDWQRLTRPCPQPPWYCAVTALIVSLSIIGVGIVLLITKVLQ